MKVNLETVATAAVFIIGSLVASAIAGFAIAATLAKIAAVAVIAVASVAAVEVIIKEALGYFTAVYFMRFATKSSDLTIPDIEPLLSAVRAFAVYLTLFVIAVLV